MQPRNRLNNRIILMIIALMSIGSVSLVRAQGMEQEPNDTCAAPHDLGALTLPFALHGSLDATPEDGDVDFYRFTAPPGTRILVEVEGASTDQGTLENPLLGFYDAQCQQRDVNDDNGFSVNARLQISVPTDGVVVVAATSCCDYGFVGNPGVSGSYRLTVSSAPLIGSINGIVVDAVTNSPLPGDFPTYTLVELRSCSELGCVSVNHQHTDSEGRFRFETDVQGQHLLAGMYQVFAAAGGYQPDETEPFAVGAGEHKEIGAVGLHSLPRIGSIGGRIVDGVTGEALPGDRPPFAFVDLVRCFGSDCFEYVSSQSADAEGRFRFESDFNGLPLQPGAYQVIARAAEYLEGEFGPFDVGEGEHKDVGDVGLQPFPVRFSEIRPCGDLPPEGGLCRYSVRITNNLATRVAGLAWSPVESFGIGAATDYTRFDAHRTRDVALDAQESQVVSFVFNVPSTVRDGATICVRVFASLGDERDGAFFNTAGQKDLFCIWKGFTGGFSMLPDAEANELFRALESGMRLSAQRMVQSGNQE